jgi:hypothetical protein
MNKVLFYTGYLIIFIAGVLAIFYKNYPILVLIGGIFLIVLAYRKYTSE